jgi:lipid II:glycine glycyltransferase (peptidoglycan interpeptide bridge formation enzyme)
VLQIDQNTSVRCEIVNLLDEWDTLRPAWDQFVDDHPKGSIFHTSDMISVYRAAKGHTPLPLAALDANGQIVALLAAVRVQTLPNPFGRISSRSIMFAEPLCGDDPDGIDALECLISHHDRLMTRRVLFTEVRPLFASGSEREALERCGYQYLEYLNHLVDLTKSPETLWSDIHRSAKRHIRTCEKRGFKVREVTGPDVVDQLYPLLELSYENAGVPLAHRSLFDAAARELKQRDMIRFFAAYDGETPIAMDAMLIYKDRIYFWYGGVVRLPNVSASSILRWRELIWGQEHGFTICDSGGAGWPDKPYGVRDFKVKFGGELVRLGRYRKVFAPRLMACAERVYELIRGTSAPRT